MKVGIITIIDYKNYGNRLQNYALVKMLEKEGIEVVSGMEVYTKKDWIKSTRKPWRKVAKYFAPWHVGVKLYNERRYDFEQQFPTEMKLRIDNFRRFTYEYTKCFTPLVVKNNRELRKIIDEKSFDYFIVGSDQVWNPGFAAEEFDFLTFTKKNKRLSYAASIGLPSLTKEQLKVLKRRLSGMRYISVREAEAKKIIERIVSLPIEVSLDPTLLLSRDEWLAMMKRVDYCLPQDYIVTYFLGEMPEVVLEFAKEKKLPVVELNSLDNRALYSIDPAEFVYILSKASYVLTDSFHGVALSIKLQKEYYVFDRVQAGVDKMTGRISDLLAYFSMSERMQNRDRIIELSRISDEKWNQIEDKLEHEREKEIGRLMGIMKR